MMPNHKDCDDSGSESEHPRISAPRKRYAPVEATEPQTHIPKAAKTGGDDTSNIQRFVSKTAAPNTTRSHLPEPLTVRNAGNTSPLTHVDQPQESETITKASTPTSSTDDTQASLSPHSIKGKGLGRISDKTQLRPVSSATHSINIAASPTEESDDSISFDFKSDSQTETVHHFNQGQQQVAFDDYQFPNSTDTSYRSSMAPQVTDVSLGDPLNTPPTNLTYTTGLITDHRSAIKDQVHHVENTPQTQYTVRTRSRTKNLTTDMCAQAKKSDRMNQRQANNTAGNDHPAGNGMNLSDNVDDWPRNVFVALEQYITHKGIWDEMDRLYMMGVQAGIGHGITAHKNCLVAEYQNVGKLWGQDVSWALEDADARRSRAERARTIQGVDVFERLAAMQAANDFISVRESIQAHAQELASIHRQNLHPTPDDPAHGLSKGPKVGNALAGPANPIKNYSLPAGQGPYIPNQTANLTAMAGSQTIGGLDTSQVDGLAGALANSIMGQNQHSMTGTRHGAPNIRININGNAQQPSAPQIKTPTLTETETGRAIIKVRTFEQQTPKRQRQ